MGGFFNALNEGVRLLPVLTKPYELMKGDCLELMERIPDGSVDMVLCDLPYGTTACKWDSVIPFEPLWAQYKRVIKDNGAIVLFGAEPFSSALRMSNIKQYKYDWLWEKERATNFANAKKMPLRSTENISIFYRKPPTYNPQGIVRIDRVMKNSRTVGGETMRENIARSAGKGTLRSGGKYVQQFTNYPKQVLRFAHDKKKLHPTQKPVPLLEYLIKTYTNEDETVLDNCMGSGSTGVACMNTNRRFIGIEMDPKYFDIAQQRIEQAASERLF